MPDQCRGIINRLYKMSHLIKARISPVDSAMKSRSIKLEVLKLRAISTELELALRNRTAKKLRKYRLHLKAAKDRALKRETARFLNEASLKLQTRYEEVVRNAHEDCLTLVHKIAHSILETELITSKETIRAKINRSINSLLDGRSVKILVNPQDVTELYEKLIACHPNCNFNIENSDQIKCGDAIISTTSGSLHLSWEKQLSKIIDRLRHNLFTSVGRA